MTKNEFVLFAKDLAEKIEMPDDATKVILEEADENFASEKIYNQCVELNDRLFSKGGDMFRAIVDFLDDNEGKDRLRFNLFLSFFNAWTTKQMYAERGWSDEVYYQSMYDLTIWTKVTFKRFGWWGLDNYDWVNHFLRCIIVRLGRLQFHVITYDHADFEHAGVRVREGDKVINIHIPEGDALTKEKRMDAYKRAYKFFGCTGKAVFICDSWLFYEKHREFLQPNSNILDFMNDFHFIEYSESHDLGDMWRVFGFPDDYSDLTKLPRNTGMQRAYADWLISHGTTGSACGVFIFDGENIL